MGFQKGKELEFKYEYDFAVSGGAVSSIALVNKGMNALEAGLVITDFHISMETTLASGGSATCTLGDAGDPDGYYVDFFAAGAAGAVLNRGKAAGANVWDDTNDAAIDYKIASAANAIPKLAIGTAALTAGKFQVYFKAYRP